MISRHSFFRRIVFALPILLAFAFAACGKSASTKSSKITIYTSIYENVIANLKPLMEMEFPDVEIEWYQKGSEEVAAKINAEIASGKVNADIVMTSDPFWYLELKNKGLLLDYESEHASILPAELKDPEHAFTTVRMPVVVMAYNRDKVKAEEAPKRFDDLNAERWAGKATMGDPLASGSAFTAVASLTKTYGWDFWQAQRKNKMVAAGGNSSVLNRLVTGEKEVGIILLENLLKAKADNPEAPIEIIYPADGAILVPSPIAIFKSCAAPDAAKKIYDYLLSQPGQNAIVAGNMYSPYPQVSPPKGAKTYAEISAKPLVTWSNEFLRDTLAQREEIKKKFSEIMAE